MQRFLFSVLLLCMQAAVLWGQNPACQVDIYRFGWQNGQTKLLAYSVSTGLPTAYLWSNGATTKTITVSDYGNYCVTATYADGCTSVACSDLSEPCSSAVTWYPDTNGSTYRLRAMPYPNFLEPGATYLWSNGATSRETVAPGPGNYCVTVTMPTGCTATACDEVPAGPYCEFGWAYSSSVGQVDRLEARPFVHGNYTWLWSTGQTTPPIPLYVNGDYCCTVTAADASCQTVKCYEVNSINCSPVQIIQNGNSLTANSLDPAAVPTAYLWNKGGATTASILVTGPGEYRVTVTFSTGCTTQASKIIPANTCSASVVHNPDNTLTAQATGAAPFVYAWQPSGQTTSMIAPTVSGYYSVVVTDANGCTALAGRHWYRADSCTVQIYIAQDSFPGNDVLLYANAEGDPTDWTYLWSNGSTSSNLFTAAAGEYCVTATNTQSGCTAVRCIWLQPGGACTAQIGGGELSPGTWQLSTASGPAAAATYAWSTGETTSNIEVKKSGYYAVTVTDAAGCTVSAYYELRPLAQLIVNVYLNGDISIAPSPGNGVRARLYLIHYDTAQGGILTAVDTTDTYSWTDWWALGAFKNVLPGYYLIKAALLPGSRGYADHLPTYYQSSVFWHDATTFKYSGISPNDWLTTAHITLVKGQNPGGTGFIGGLVTEGANFTGNLEDRGEGDPLPGISIVLTLPDGTPVAHATTDASGQYSFPNLPWGTYVLTIDVPGLAPVSTTVAISPSQPSALNVNFKVDGNSAGVSGTDDPAAAVFAKIYPNPVRDVLWVESAESLHLSLLNAQGQTVRQLLSSDLRTPLLMADLPAGMYFLAVRTAAGAQVLKVVRDE